MPELPEVQTTVDGLNRYVKGLTITDVWTSYKSPHHKGKDNIKDPAYFKKFKQLVLNQKILHTKRRAKNILIFLSNDYIILVHMKMTGHFLYGAYTQTKTTWIPLDKHSSLANNASRFIRLLFTLSDGLHLAFSDLRKFAKVTLIHKKDLDTSLHLKDLGPEPLDSSFTLHIFKNQVLLHPKGKIKQVLLDPSIIVGIGNIYSDEILFRAHIHPERIVSSLTNKELKAIFNALKTTLQKGIDFGGDSTSDYRNILGEAGVFQESHLAYRRTNSPCSKKGCKGIITRKKIGSRNAHFCNSHQI